MTWHANGKCPGGIVVLEIEDATWGIGGWSMNRGRELGYTRRIMLRMMLLAVALVGLIEWSRVK